MTALQRHAYAPAADAFGHLMKDFPTERTLLDRARVYLELCHREMARRPPSPETSEDRLAIATLALNNGKDRDAEVLARRVLVDDPKKDLASYLLAVIEARRGHADAALAHLEQTIRLNPDARVQARHDDDFASLKDSDAFKALTGSTGAGAQRRAR